MGGHRACLEGAGPGRRPQWHSNRHLRICPDGHLCSKVGSIRQTGAQGPAGLWSGHPMGKGVAPGIPSVTLSQRNTVIVSTGNY